MKKHSWKAQYSWSPIGPERQDQHEDPQTNAGRSSSDIRPLRLVAMPVPPGVDEIEVVHSLLMEVPCDYLLVDIETASAELLAAFSPEITCCDRTGISKYSCESIDRFAAGYRAHADRWFAFLFGGFSKQELAPIRAAAENGDLFRLRPDNPILNSCTDYYSVIHVDMGSQEIVCNRKELIDKILSVAGRFADIETAG